MNDKKSTGELLAGLSAYDLSEMSQEISATLAQGGEKEWGEIARFVTELGDGNPDLLRLILPPRLYNKLQTQLADKKPQRRFLATLRQEES